MEGCTIRIERQYGDDLPESLHGTVQEIFDIEHDFLIVGDLPPSVFENGRAEFCSKDVLKDSPYLYPVGNAPTQPRRGHQGAINVQDESKRTLLHHASIAGLGRVVEFLLEKNAMPDIPDAFNHTPLQYAATSSKPIVDLLLQAGASPNVPIKPRFDKQSGKAINLSAEAYAVLFNRYDIFKSIQRAAYATVANHKVSTEQIDTWVENDWTFLGSYLQEHIPVANDVSSSSAPNQVPSQAVETTHSDLDNAYQPEPGLIQTKQSFPMTEKAKQHPVKIYVGQADIDEYKQKLLKNEDNFFEIQLFQLLHVQDKPINLNVNLVVSDADNQRLQVYVLLKKTGYSLKLTDSFGDWMKRAAGFYKIPVDHQMIFYGNTVVDSDSKILDKPLRELGIDSNTEIYLVPKPQAEEQVPMFAQRIQNYINKQDGNKKELQIECLGNMYSWRGSPIATWARKSFIQSTAYATEFWHLETQDLKHRANPGIDTFGRTFDTLVIYGSEAECRWKNEAITRFKGQQFNLHYEMCPELYEHMKQVVYKTKRAELRRLSGSNKVHTSEQEAKKCFCIHYEDVPISEIRNAVDCFSQAMQGRDDETIFTGKTLFELHAIYKAMACMGYRKQNTISKLCKEVVRMPDLPARVVQQAAKLAKRELGASKKPEDIEMYFGLEPGGAESTGLREGVSESASSSGVILRQGRTKLTYIHGKKHAEVVEDKFVEKVIEAYGQLST